MSIANALGRSGFRATITGKRAGLPLGENRVSPGRMALLAKLVGITIAGFGADTDAVTVSITLPDGTVVAETTTRAASVPVDDAAAAAALAVLINARAALRGVVVASSLAAVLSLAFVHPNIDYPVATTVVGCTATVAVTQAAGGSAMAVARFVKRGAVVPSAIPGQGAPAIAPLVASDVAASIWGVLCSRHMAVQAESALANAAEVIPLGETGDVLWEGIVPMRNAGGGTASAGGQVHAVVATTGGNEIGEARAASDGVTAEVWTVTPTASESDFAVEVVWTQTTGEIQRTILQSANPDGSASATEIANGFRTSLTEVQVDGRLTGFAGSGTATFILTGPAGQSFTVDSIGEGAAATVETTPSVPYTVPISLSRAQWIDETPEGAVGDVMVRMIA